MYQFLIVNPGSTSTKIAVFKGEEQIFSETISHRQEELANFSRIKEQKTFRTEVLLDCLKENQFDLSAFSGIIAIGGLLRNVDSGVYKVSDSMVTDLEEGSYGEHAANLGGLIARSLGDASGIPSYIADPITVDEMQPVARISGHPLLPRYGRTHTLNHKRVAMAAAKELGKSYKDARLIVAHLGGGVSIGAHAGGRIIDSTSSRGEGAFSMDRSGGLNGWELAKLCFSEKYSKKEVLAMLNGKGGISAYLDTRDFRDVEKMAELGQQPADDVFNGFVYQVAKEIASMAAVLDGDVDAVILTGGIVYSEKVVSILNKKIGFISRIMLYPGEKEMESLAFYMNSVLNGELEVKKYERIKDC